jgi:cyclopropane-fatty-acyl-phospholipid synthase
MFQPLATTLNDFVKDGHLEVIDVDDRPHTFGRACDETSPSVTVALKDRSLYWKLAVDPEFHLGEAYMNGTLELDKGSISDLMDLCGRNLARRVTGRQSAFTRSLRHISKHLMQLNSLRRAQRNASHHYDLSRQLYETFLDRDLQYSCAYFQSDGVGWIKPRKPRSAT